MSFIAGDLHLLLDAGLLNTGDFRSFRGAVGELGADLDLENLVLSTVNIALLGRSKIKEALRFCLRGSAECGRLTKAGKCCPGRLRTFRLLPPFSSESSGEQTVSFGRVTSDTDLCLDTWVDPIAVTNPPECKSIVSTDTNAGAELLRPEFGLEAAFSFAAKYLPARNCCSSFCRFSYLFWNNFIDWTFFLTSVCITSRSIFIRCSAIAFRTIASFSVELSLS